MQQFSHCNISLTLCFLQAPYGSMHISVDFFIPIAEFTLVAEKAVVSSVSEEL